MHRILYIAVVILFWRLNKESAATVMRSGDWKYFDTSKQGAPAELYDLSSDPLESNNLATTRPEIVQRFEKMIGQWESELPTKYIQTKQELKKQRPIASVPRTSNRVYECPRRREYVDPLIIISNGLQRTQEMKL